jgi:lambda repressor-like predicted transcriptional regulator
MALNLELKIAILKSGLTQVEISRTTGIHETTLSQIVRGLEATPEQKKLIAKALRVRPETLFGRVEASA